MDEDLSPAVIRKSVHLATKLPSFQSAQENIAETIEVELATKRVERLTERIGRARVYEREIDTRRWDALRLVEKLAAPPGVKLPQMACVSCDGGRMQRCDLPEDAKSHWCETKVGILLELKPSVHEEDPCPELPDTFRNLGAALQTPALCADPGLHPCFDVRVCRCDGRPHQRRRAPIYLRWINWLWQGQVSQVIAEVAARADQISDTQPLSCYWIRRSHSATGTRTYTKAA